MNANPFIAAQQSLRYYISRHKLPTEQIQLYILSGILAVGFLTALIALILRIKNKTFWLFRVVEGYILPSGANTWLISSISFGFLGQLYIFKPELTIANLFYVDSLDSLCWLPVWTGRWILTWAISVSAARIISPNKNYSLFFNLFFFIGIFLTIIPPVVLAFIGYSHHYAGNKLLEIVDKELTIAIQKFNDGTPVDLTLLQSLSPKIDAEYHLYELFLRSSLIYWTCTGLAEGLLFLIGSIIYLRTINNSNSIVKQLQSNGKLSGISNKLQGLLISSSLSLCVVIAHCGGLLYLSTGGNGGEIFALILLWSYVVLGGLFGSIALLLRSFDPPANKNSDSTQLLFKKSKGESVYQVELDRVGGSGFFAEQKYDKNEV